MPLEDSPNVEIFKEGLSAKLPNPSGQRRQLRVVILGLLLVVLVLGVVKVANGPVGVVLRGTGEVQGRVSDDRGQPIAADIYILGTQRTTRCDANGTFALADVPAGKIALVANYRGQGVEQLIQLNVGTVLNIGEIRIAATTMPPQ
jgi:hypothetical protein